MMEPAPAKPHSALGACWASGQGDTSLPAAAPLKICFMATGGAFLGGHAGASVTSCAGLRQSSPCPAAEPRG